MPAAPPVLRAMLHRVTDVERAARFFDDALGCPVSLGPRPGWSSVDVGAGQALYLAPGGRALEPIRDRWEQQGIIPILKTLAFDDEAARLDERNVGWVNRLIEYDMKGHARLAYFLGPDNHPIGIQQRLADTQREEDLTTNTWLSGLDAAPRWLGIGWVIYQAVDIVSVRDFVQRALGWPQVRGTEGFGYMMTISPMVILQIAFKGRTLDPHRDLSREPVLPVIETVDVSGLQARVRDQGGAVVEGVDGFAAIADPEGRVLLIREPAA